jgi:hypothetical protein
MINKKVQASKKINRMSISSGYKEIEFEDKAFWLSQKPIKRLQYIEILRKINYGKEASKRLQRILEITKRT